MPTEQLTQVSPEPETVSSRVFEAQRLRSANSQADCPIAMDSLAAMWSQMAGCAARRTASAAALPNGNCQWQAGKRFFTLFVSFVWWEQSHKHNQTVCAAAMRLRDYPHR